MSGPAAPPDLRARARASRSRVARRVLDQPLRRMGVTGALVLLAATAAFGGLEAQTQDGPEVLTVDVPAEVAPFEITVRRVVWTTDLPGQELSDGANRWIGVVASVRSTSDAGILGGTLQDALTLADVRGLVPTPGTGVPRPTVVVLDDGSTLSPVQPGLTYEVAYLWEQDGGEQPPTDATVLLQQHTWRPDSLGGGDLGWRDPTTTWRGVVDVRQAVSDTPAVEDP